MATGLERFGGGILLIQSGNDYTAREFDEYCRADPRWRRLVGQPRLFRVNVEGADHTFSRSTHQQAADAVGRSRSGATNLLRLLQLAKPAQDMLMAGDIEMGHARALLAIKDPKVQVQLADEAVRQALSVRALEELARQHAVGLPGAAPAAKKKDPKQIKAAWLKEIEETLRKEMAI